MSRISSRKSQAPSTKLQTNSKARILNGPNGFPFGTLAHLIIGACLKFGACDLVL
jgi:hypothetical protein